jgi:hypothetical protein
VGWIGVALIVIGFLSIVLGLIVATIIALRKTPTPAAGPGTENLPTPGWPIIVDIIKAILGSPAGIFFVVGAGCLYIGIVILEKHPL